MNARVLAGVLAVVALVCGALLVRRGGEGDSPPRHEGHEGRSQRGMASGSTSGGASYVLANVAGGWMEADGARGFVVAEQGGDAAWPGRVQFVPAIGDWVAVLRCRVRGAWLELEVPTQTRGTVVVQFVEFAGINRAECRLEPWAGSYERR